MISNLGQFLASFQRKILISDSRPRGPESVSMDVTFVDSRHLYGLPEHTDSFVLANTEGKYINLFLI